MVSILLVIVLWLVKNVPRYEMGIVPPQPKGEQGNKGDDGIVLPSLFSCPDDEEGDGNRYDVCPVCRHDIDVGKGEAKSYVQQHVKEEWKHGHPQEPLSSSRPYTGKEEYEYEYLCNVVDAMSVADKDRSLLKVGILQEIILMKLQSFSEDVMSQ